MAAPSVVMVPASNAIDDARVSTTVVLLSSVGVGTSREVGRAKAIEAKLRKWKNCILIE
jgi:hypothetical protein